MFVKEKKNKNLRREEKRGSQKDGGQERTGEKKTECNFKVRFVFSSGSLHVICSAVALIFSHALI